MRRRDLFFHTFLSLGIAPLLTSQTEKPPTVDEAITTAARLLVENQERYEPDPPVGSLPEDELPKWQKKERKRLDRIRRGKDRAEWPYEGVYRIRPDGRIPPGYRVGGTAIVCLALAADPEFDAHTKAHAAIDRAIEFMLDELENNEKLEAGPKQGYDVRGWGHTYALEFFLFAERSGLVEGEVLERVKKMIPHLLQCIATNEVPKQGGWNYAGPTLSPFMTGSTLIALYRAREQGYQFDHGMVERALDGLERARTKTGSYEYAGEARRPVAMPGACARAAIAELCLYQAGRSDEQRLRNAIYAFFVHWDQLFVRKSQQGTHVRPYGVAPYYFMYAHTYAAMAIELMPNEADRNALRLRMQETLWSTREDDGGWNDRIFPRTKSYSTAMAILALAAPQLDKLPEWSTEKPATTPK